MKGRDIAKSDDLASRVKKAEQEAVDIWARMYLMYEAADMMNKGKIDIDQLFLAIERTARDAADDMQNIIGTLADAGNFISKAEKGA